MENEKPRRATAEMNKARVGGSRPGTVGRVGALALLAAYPIVGTTYTIGALTEMMILAIFALSIGFLMGYPNLVSLGHAAFFGGGAYATGVVTVRLEMANVFVTLAIALVFAALLAVLVGVLSLQNTGIYFLMITLALAQMLYVIAQQWTSLTGGSDGLYGIPYPEFFGSSFDGGALYYLVLIVAGGSYFLLRLVTRSPFGQALIGIGANEGRMHAIGYNTRSYKLTAFVLSGAIAGMAGALWAHHNGIVAPEDINWPLSATALIMVVVGGTGTLAGPMLGAVLVWFLDTGLGSYTERSTMIMGVVFVFFVFFARDGIVGLVKRVWRGMNDRT
jgi:branched-chain amino acid transport system permease protein